MQSHNLEHKSAKRKRAFSKTFEVAAKDTPRLKKLLGLK
jgi:ribosomal protein L35